MIRLCLVFTLFSCSLAFAQTGPGGVGTTNGSSTLNGWWRADKGLTLNGSAVSNWADQSGYAHDLEQSNPANQPTSGTSSALNNQSVVRYDGAINQYFIAPSFTGPGSNNATVFFAANGSNYQLLLFFFDSGSSYFIFPGAVPASELFISTDGGFSDPVNGGLAIGVNNVSAARYSRNKTNGMQTYLNGGVFAQRNSADAALPSGSFFSGFFGTSPTADVGEMIVYLSALNDAQMVIVQNYLAAKYNTALSANDVYTMDDAANGNYDYDVAGIGQTNASNSHNDSRGTGILRILNPSDLEDGEFFMWGSDNGAAQTTNTSDVPSGVTARFERVWRVSETGGDVGSIDVQLDVTGLADFASLSTCDAALSLQLLVDTDNDGVFADQTPITGATSLGNNVYRFANVTALANGRRFTFGLVNSAVNGPGGVGGTNGTTSLQLWLTANKGITTSGSNVISWADQAGTGRIATAPVSTARPLVIPNSVNGQPRLSFDGTTDILELNTNINTTTPTMFTIMNKGSAGVTTRIFLSLQNNQWFGRSASTNQWGMFNNTDVLSGSTINNLSFFLLSSVERNPNDVDFSTNGVLTTATNGTGFSGTSLGSIGASNSGSSNTGVNFFQGNIAELIVYTTNLNRAQRLIVENALAAKYGLTLGGGIDVYTMDNPVNGNFDFDVAGIARVDALNHHTDSKGESIVRISGATDLADNESFFWGHNNTALTVSSADVPSGVQSRLAREWGVSETGDVGAINIQFDLSGLYGSITPADLRLLIDHDGDGIYNEAATHSISGATASSCGYYTFSGVTVLNNAMRFTLGTINFSQTPLPVELVTFEGEASAGGVLLTWETESELNNDYFTVERSVTGTDFIPVGTLAGAGTSNERHTYALLDVISFSGTLYYRLKQTDFDGATSYSKVIRITGTAAESISVYPNPVRAGDDFYVTIHEGYSRAEACTLSITDVMGRQIFRQPATIDGTQLELSVAGNVAPGVYVLRIDFPDGGRRIFRKVNVVR